MAVVSPSEGEGTETSQGLSSCCASCHAEQNLYKGVIIALEGVFPCYDYWTMGVSLLCLQVGHSGSFRQSQSRHTRQEDHPCAPVWKPSHVHVLGGGPSHYALAAVVLACVVASMFAKVQAGPIANAYLSFVCTNVAITLRDVLDKLTQVCEALDSDTGSPFRWLCDTAQALNSQVLELSVCQERGGRRQPSPTGAWCLKAFWGRFRAR